MSKCMEGEVGNAYLGQTFWGFNGVVYNVAAYTL